MELLSIGTAEEAELITSYLAANRLSDTDYWTSGNQLGSHHWMWMATGERFNGSFNYWAAEEPFTSKQGNLCMSANNGAWVPQSCMDEKYFICELTRCFFVNFVSASRSSSQGALPTTPRIPLRRNKSPPRPIASQAQSPTHQPQQQRQPEPRPQPHRATAAQSQTRQPGTSSFPQPTVTPDRGITATTLDLTTFEGDTFPTTGEPPKTMPTPVPEELPEDTTDHVKIMPGVNLDLDRAVHNNEIIHSRPINPPTINPLQLLQPPTREFSTSSFSPSPFSSPSSPSSIPLQPEASSNFTVRRPLSRKETFSWAFLDQGSN
ncbi:mucin-2-like isoform X2 [Eriocheir sinensis]|nr:mucin-2-like isoform X2 [Eriocheir sinensis]